MSQLEDVRRLSHMMEAWTSLVGQRESEIVSTWTADLIGMMDARHKIVTAGGWAAGPSTLMGVLDLQRAEVANCSIVRWLLDPLARHGIGVRMVSRLADRLGLSIAEPSTFRAAAEVVRPQSRADVVLTSASTTIVIEAKIDAPEGPTQAARLEDDWPPPASLVFLTVSGGILPRTAQEADRWKPLSWSWIAGAALEAMEETPRPTDHRGVEAQQTVMTWISDVERYLR